MEKHGKKLEYVPIPCVVSLESLRSIGWYISSELKIPWSPGCERVVARASVACLPRVSRRSEGSPARGPGGRRRRARLAGAVPCDWPGGGAWGGRGHARTRGWSLIFSPGTCTPETATTRQTSPALYSIEIADSRDGRADDEWPLVGTVECGYGGAGPWPLDLEWSRKLYPPARPMFGLHHHHQDPTGLHHHHHHHQPRGPVTGLKEEPLTTSQLAAARAWMQPAAVEQSSWVPHLQLLAEHYTYQ